MVIMNDVGCDAVEACLGSIGIACGTQTSRHLLCRRMQGMSLTD
jgi:hypothetical protein